MESGDINMSELELQDKNYASQKYDIEIINITKNYSLKGKNKTITALNKVNLKIQKGEIFGLLGPNGAGKTTLVSILTTLLQPSSGYATVLGHNVLEDPWFIKNNVGLMLGGDMIYHRITGYKNLKFFCKIYGIKDFKKKIYDMTDSLNLSKWLNQYTETYSKGMKLKLALARVLLIEPKILFLDEPMLGLDPNSVQNVIELLRNTNKTIFFTSHQMDVVQKICNRIAFLKEGEIIKVDTQENFKKLIMEKINIHLKVRKNSEKLNQLLNSLNFISDVKAIDKDFLFSIQKEDYFPELFKHLKDFPVLKFNQIEPDLSEVFINLSK